VILPLFDQPFPVGKVRSALREFGTLFDQSVEPLRRLGFWAQSEPFPGTNVLNGRSLQCQYTSLSGRMYWTVVDFDHADNSALIAIRFYTKADCEQ
jgi:hypothetical protein